MNLTNNNLTDHDKAQIAKIKPNTKIRILSDEHRVYISKLFNSVNPIDLNIFGFVNYLFFETIDKNPLITWSYTHLEDEFDRKAAEEIFIDLPPKELKIAEPPPSTASNIKPPFKFRNANLPVVREWLRDQGYCFINEQMDITIDWLQCDLGRIDERGHFYVS